MSYTVIDCEQRSDEWRKARLGRLTGSRAADFLAMNKNGTENYKRRDLRTTLVLERLTGLPQDDDGYRSKEMQRGIDREADARAAYEARTRQIVHQSGFLSHDDIMAGCSLDGHVSGYRGIIELKAPKSVTHLRYLRCNGTLPDEYIGQVTHNLWISGAQWCDSVSFDDRFPPELRLVIARVYRDPKAMKAYELLVVQFMREVDQEVEEVRGLIAQAVVA